MSRAADLTARQRKAVLDDFRRLGWDPRKLRKSHRAPVRAVREPPQSPATPDLPLTGIGWGKDQQLHDRIKADLWRQAHLGERPAYRWEDAAMAWMTERGATTPSPIGREGGA